MDTSTHDLSGLFQQLGLPADEAGMSSFLEAHRPLPAHVPLHEVDFWNPAQAALLREAIEEDSDWAEVVDELDAMLRSGD